MGLRVPTQLSAAASYWATFDYHTAVMPELGKASNRPVQGPADREWASAQTAKATLNEAAVGVAKGAVVNITD